MAWQPHIVHAHFLEFQQGDWGHILVNDNTDSDVDDRKRTL